MSKMAESIPAEVARTEAAPAKRVLPLRVRVVRTFAVICSVAALLLVGSFLHALWQNPGVRNKLALVPIFRLSYEIPESENSRISMEWISSKVNFRTNVNFFRAGRYLQRGRGAIVADSAMGGLELHDSKGSLAKKLPRGQVVAITDWYLQRRVWKPANFPMDEREGLLEVDRNRGYLNLSDLFSGSSIWRAEAPKLAGSTLGEIHVLYGPDGVQGVLAYSMDNGAVYVFDMEGEFLFETTTPWEAQIITGQFNSDEDFEIAIIQQNSQFHIFEMDGTLTAQGKLQPVFPQPAIYYPVVYEDGSFGLRGDHNQYKPVFYDLQGELVSNVRDQITTVQNPFYLTGQPIWINEEHLIFASQNSISIVHESGRVADWIVEENISFELMSTDPSRGEAIVLVYGMGVMGAQVAKLSFD